MFRHTFTREFLRSGQGDIRDLSQLLGHRSIKTTEDYYLAFVLGRAQELNEKVRASFAAQGAPGYEPVAEPKRVSIN
jgi:integrase